MLEMYQTKLASIANHASHTTDSDPPNFFYFFILVFDVRIWRCTNNVHRLHRTAMKKTCTATTTKCQFKCIFHGMSEVLCENHFFPAVVISNGLWPMTSMGINGPNMCLVVGGILHICLNACTQRAHSNDSWQFLLTEAHIHVLKQFTGWHALTAQLQATTNKSVANTTAEYSRHICPFKRLHSTECPSHEMANFCTPAMQRCWMPLLCYCDPLHSDHF